MFAVHADDKEMAEIEAGYKYDRNTEAGRRALADEFLAHWASARGVAKPAWYKSMVAQIRAWIRKVFPSLKWSDTEAEVEIQNALSHSDKLLHNDGLAQEQGEAAQKADAKSQDAVRFEVEAGSRRFNEEQAVREYAWIKDRYSGKSLWMKAPNGVATNLSELQWVQTRTPSFKDYYGDWEALAIRKRLGWTDVVDASVIRNMASQDITGVKPVPDKKALQMLFKSFGDVTNQDGTTVRFPVQTAGKFIYKKNYASAFKSLFESSIHMSSQLIMTSRC